MNPRFPLQAAVLAASLLGCAGALAQSRAVEATHFELGFSSIESDTSDSASSGTLGADFTVTFPLGSYFGASLGAVYSDANVRTNEILPADTTTSSTRPSCGFENLGGNASLFFRRPDFGRVGVTYGMGDLSSDCDGDAVFPITGDDKLSTDFYRVNAEYYFRNFTFGAGYTTTKLEDGQDLKSTSLAASWYPFDSLKVALTANDLYDDNTYGIQLEHQPEMMGDGLSVRLGVSTTSEDPKTLTIQLGLSYYFGRHVTLKVRDRQYR
ncbi:MAG TPA: hypothetical protein VKB34_07335 [Povalibacter sp.]|nr:hypothetical protein [Povalibacter sp.]